MSEKQIEKKLRECVESLGGLCIKFYCMTFTGLPDRIILLPGGSVCFAELKAPGKTPKPRQTFVHGMLTRLGFQVFRCVDSLEKVNAVIEWAKKRIAA